MCLKLFKAFERPLVATQDIPVVKYLKRKQEYIRPTAPDGFGRWQARDEWLSPYFDEPYPFGVNQIEPAFVKEPVCRRERKGHGMNGSYGRAWGDTIKRLMQLAGMRSEAHVGFHSMERQWASMDNEGWTAFKAVIPAGSEYYDGEFNEHAGYVSNQLKVLPERLDGKPLYEYERAAPLTPQQDAFTGNMGPVGIEPAFEGNV
jgi:hypothetical protein